MPQRFTLFALLALTLCVAAAAQPPADGDEVVVNTYTTSDQSNPAVAADAAGQFVVVWRSLFQDGDQLGIFGQRFDAEGNALGGEFQANQLGIGAQTAPAVAMEPLGDFVVTWTDLPNPMAGPRDGDGAGIFGRRFQADGTPQGGDFQVHSYVVDDQDRSAVTMAPGGRFAAAWMSDAGDGSDQGIFAQSFASNGTPIGTELLVNSTTVNGQRDPAIASDASGNFVVAWYDYGFPSPDGDLFGVFAQRFDSSGAPLGGELQVNSTTAGYQFEPAVAMHSNGEFVVAWDSYFQDGDRDGIFVQRFDSSGVAVGAEMQVNTYTTGRQHSADVAMGSTGGFVVTWQSEEGFGSGGPQSRIVARTFDSAGQPIGGEFQVNTSPTPYTYFPSVATTGSESFVIAWQRRAANGDFDVVARRYGEPDAVDPALVGLWSFDEGSGTLAANGAANDLDGILEGGADWSTGQQGAALALDGIDDLVRVTDPGSGSPLDVTDALSLSAWVRPDRLDGSTQVLISKDNAYELEIGKLGAAVWDLRLDNRVVATAPTSLEEGVWQHLAVTWDGATVRFYYNGALDASMAFVGSLQPNDDDLGLGGRPSSLLQGGPVFHLAGALDEVTVYNRVLSDAEVAQQVSSTMSDLSPPLRSNLQPSTSLPAGTTVATLSLSTDEAATCRYDSVSGVRFDDMASDFTSTGGTAHGVDLAVSDDTIYRLYVRCRDAFGNRHGEDAVITFGVGDSNLTTGAIADWPMDEASGCTVFDGVADHHGALGPACPSNGPLWDLGHDGGAGLLFDGVDDQLTVANTAALGSPAGLTLSAWIRHPGNTWFRALFDARDAAADGYDLYLEPSSRLLLRINDGVLVGQTVVADGTWHHVVGTWDGTVLRLYVDGRLDAEATVGATGLDVAADLFLGRNFATVDYVYDGALSRAAVWGRALSSVEVLDHYLATR